MAQSQRRLKERRPELEKKEGWKDREKSANTPGLNLFPQQVTKSPKHWTRGQPVQGLRFTPQVSSLSPSFPHPFIPPQLLALLSSGVSSGWVALSGLQIAVVFSSQTEEGDGRTKGNTAIE